MNVQHTLDRFAAVLWLAVAAAMAAMPDTASAVCQAGNPNSNMAESTPTADFIDHGNGTVTHKLTGLTWKKCIHGLSGPACSVGTASMLEWADALKAAVTDSTAGFNDWRLPNRMELGSIIEWCGSGPAINQTVFPATPGAQFDFQWTSTTYLPAERAAGIHMLTGDMFILAKAGFGRHFRLVRGGRNQDAFDAQPPQLTIARLGTGAGTVTSDPAGISCGATCSHGFASSASVTLTATASAGSIFAGWLGACTGTAPCVLTVRSATSVSATFSPNTITLRAEVDGDNTYDALTDGLLIMRYLFGRTGDALTSHAVSPTGSRKTPEQVVEYLDSVRPILDVDGNGKVDALTDGVILMRYMFRLRGQPMVAGAIGAGATRTDPGVIQAYIESILP